MTKTIEICKEILQSVTIGFISSVTTAAIFEELLKVFIHGLGTVLFGTLTAIIVFFIQRYLKKKHAD